MGGILGNAGGNKPRREGAYEDIVVRWGNEADRKILAKIAIEIRASYGITIHDFRHYIITLKNKSPVALLCYNIVRHKKHGGKPMAQVELYNIDAQPHAARLIDKMREIHPDLEMVYGRATPSAIKAAKRYAEARGLKIMMREIKAKSREIIRPGTKDVFLHLPKPKALNIRRVK